MAKVRDEFTKAWIIANAVDICDQYDDGVLTLRSLHYQLVSIGMTNDIQHYKRVVSAMESARWDGLIGFEKFSDLDRSMLGTTAHEETVLEDQIALAKRQVRAWMRNYNKNRWENQPLYPEVLIEKKALQGVFAPVCEKWDVSIGACKGYPSLTFLHQMYERFKLVEESGKSIVLLYFGDYDPSGEDIPRSIVSNLSRFGIHVHLQRIALMESQVREWKLPAAPAKATDSRTQNWGGIGQVELDAVKPERLQSMCESAIDALFNDRLYLELMETEKREKALFQTELRRFVNEDLRE